MYKHSLIFTLVLFVSANSFAEIIHIATGEYPPLTSESLDHGGYINRIVSSAFALSNIEVKYHYMPWKRALETTRIGQFQASSFWGDSKKRHKDFIHSDVIDKIHFIFFYRTLNKNFTWNTLNDLQHYKIGATRGYTYTEAFWSLKNKDQFRISIANDDTENLKRLIKGQIDIFPISKLTGMFLLSKNFTKDEAAKVSLYPKALSQGKNLLLFSKLSPGNEVLVEKFNQGLKILKEQNKLALFRQELVGSE